MADLGAIGINNGTVPLEAAQMGSPWWFSPLNRAIVTRDDGSQGPEPTPFGYASGAVPAIFVTTIAANFGQAGGGISIF